MASFRRNSRSKIWKAASVLLGIIFAFDFLKLSSIRSADHHSKAIKDTKSPQSVYIASIFWNSAAILYNSWNDAIMELAAELGAKHIYISIYESGSWDETKEALRQLETLLQARGISHRIILDDTTHEDDLAQPPASQGWVKTPRGRTELRRIPYLSRLRNKTLGPLVELAANGTKFDKVLFINDVAFTVLHFLLIPLATLMEK